MRSPYWAAAPEDMTISSNPGGVGHAALHDRDPVRRVVRSVGARAALEGGGCLARDSRRTLPQDLQVAVEADDGARLARHRGPGPRPRRPVCEYPVPVMGPNSVKIRTSEALVLAT